MTKAPRPRLGDAKGPRVILCADDYGIAPGVSAGIRQLIGANRLTATSCMTAAAHWQEQGTALRPFSGQVDIGLHLTLTGLAPLGDMPSLAPTGQFPEYPVVLRKALSGQLDRDEIMHELSRQIDRFEDVMGRLPDFVDGHHHVHQLPVVRDAVFSLLGDRFNRHQVYVRVSSDTVPTVVLRGVSVIKSLLIGAFGSGMRRRAARLGIATNFGFTGAYNFAATDDYALLFPSFLKGAKDGTLIMCHPGEPDAELARVDQVTTAREAELRYFLSDQFLHHLQEAGIRHRRFFDQP